MLVVIEFFTLIVFSFGSFSRLYRLEQQPGGRLSYPVLLLDIEQYKRGCAQPARSSDAGAVPGSHVLHGVVAVHILAHHLAVRSCLSQNV